MKVNINGVWKEDADISSASASIIGGYKIVDIIQTSPNGPATVPNGGVAYEILFGQYGSVSIRKYNSSIYGGALGGILIQLYPI